MSKIFKGSRDKIKVKCTAENIVDGSRINKVSFSCIYKALPNSEARQVLQGSKDGDISDLDIVNRYLVGWEDVLDDDDQPIEYTPENVESAMEVTAYRAAIITGFMQSMFGREILKQKN